MPRVLISVLTVVLLAGCARAETGGDPEIRTDGVMSNPDELGGPCRDPWSAPAVEPSYQALPADFVAVLASRCIHKIVPVPGDGEWMAIEEQAASTGLETLLRALRLPPVDNGAPSCTLQMRTPVVITVTDAAGKTITPKVPVNQCSDPLPEVVNAIAALTWTATKQTNIGRARSQLQVDSGCGGSWKPMVALEATNPTPKTHNPAIPTPMPTTMTICRYALDPAETMPGFDNLGSYAAGKLSSAGDLTGAKLNAFLSAIATASPAQPCDKPQAPFAIVAPKSGGPWTAVELGGCYRGTGDFGGLFQLDAATVALISG